MVPLTGANAALDAIIKNGSLTQSVKNNSAGAIQAVFEDSLVTTSIVISNPPSAAPSKSPVTSVSHFEKVLQFLVISL